MNEDQFGKLIKFLRRLDSAKIYYTLWHHRENAIRVDISVPGERWEVEFLDGEPVEVERFRSDAKIYGEEVIDELFEKHSD